MAPDTLSFTSPPLPDLSELRDSPEGRHGLCFDGDTTAQLLFLRGCEPDQPLAALIPLDDDALERIGALIRFWRSWHGRTPAADTRMTEQQRRRLKLMVQAADGRAEGATYREIAIGLFGSERVASEAWKTSSLRDRIIGLVRGGLAVISGGYRRLLRHRRRS